MCNNKTNRDRSCFLNLQRTCFQTFAIFLVPKITPTKTPETREPLFPQKESQKIQFFDFSVKICDDEKNSVSKLPFSSRNQL